jgi:hypothetical protein
MPGDGSTLVQLLLAFIAGGGLTALVTVGTRRAEFRREDRARWLSERRDAYARIADRTAAMGNAALLASLHARVEGFQEEVREHCTAVHDTFQAMQADFAVLQLLAPQEVVREGLRLQHAAGEVMKHTLAASVSGTLRDPDEVEVGQKALYACLDDFLQEARRDIGA